jgi:hypothetical protein
MVLTLTSRLSKEKEENFFYFVSNYEASADIIYVVCNLTLALRWTRDKKSHQRLRERKINATFGRVATREFKKW